MMNDYEEMYLMFNLSEENEAITKSIANY